MSLASPGVQDASNNTQESNNHVNAAALATTLLSQDITEIDRSRWNLSQHPVIYLAQPSQTLEGWVVAHDAHCVFLKLPGVHENLVVYPKGAFAGERLPQVNPTQLVRLSTTADGKAHAYGLSTQHSLQMCNTL